MPGIIPTAPKYGPLPGARAGGGIPGWLLRRIGTMATLGVYNFEHPQQSQEYWSEIGHELDPRTMQGLVALGATVFGPRLEDPAITSLNAGSTRDLVPLPRGPKLGQKATGNPVRNLQHDYANPVVARLIRARETEPVAHHIESVAKRASITAQPENLHDYVDNTDVTRGEPFIKPPHAVLPGLSAALHPAQVALLKRLLANHL